MTPEPVLRHQLRAGAYFDSVVLMQLQRALAELPGVLDAGVVMATPANLEILSDGSLLPADAAGAAPDDLLVVVKAETEEAAESALAGFDGLLAKRRGSAVTEFRPRSLEGALRQLPDARWALISVPGRYAAAVAREALERNLNVFLYSDNVALEDEVELKLDAAHRGLMVMGPDCGTAMVGGSGLGFANRVRTGGVGLVGASGTGLQAVASRIHTLGGGVSQILGTGGRDLSAAVGGITSLAALDLLRRDPRTEVIVIVSKPPDPEVAGRVLAAAEATGKPVVVHFQGHPELASRLRNGISTVTLEETADRATERVDALSESGSGASPRDEAGHGGLLRGLFSGGTLAYEALLGLRGLLAPLASNLKVEGVIGLGDAAAEGAHTLLDLGADEYTVGRPHPMLDYDLRVRQLRQATAEPEVGVVLLDVVLGDGAHPDPSAELGPAIRESLGAADAAKRGLEVLVVLVGTDEDPQDLEAQRAALEEAGARVYAGLGSALSHLAKRFPGAAPEVVAEVALDDVHHELAAVNIGLESFADSLKAQGARAVHVDWRPPAGGDERLASILARMRS